MNKLIISLTFSLFLLTPVFACDQHGKTGIVAENNLYIGVNQLRPTGISEAEFNEAIDRAIEIYGPIIEAKGKTLVVERKWDDGTVNAYAQQSGNTWKVSMFGGLARHETITKDAFATVVCHELGHHLGGAPKKASWFGSAWASNEGQADYWGSGKCMKKYFEKDDNVSIMANVEIDPLAKAKCEGVFADAEEQAKCQRAAMAGMSLANLFRALRDQTEELKFETPDTNVVSKTDDNHPAAQCRLDTYFQGALCDKSPYEDVSDSDATTGVCNRSDSYEAGIRPLCWFKPGAADGGGDSPFPFPWPPGK